MSEFKTDLNQRERRRHAKNLRKMSEAARELADNLEAEDDDRATVNLVMVALCGQGMQELMEVVVGEAEANAAASRLRSPRDFT